MTRHWLLTSTTYGTWLPGDRRGFVGSVRADDGPRVRHNDPGTAYNADMPNLHRSAQALMNGPPVLLSAEQAAVVVAQFRQTCAYRQWELHAAAVMANHFHAVVSADETTRTDAILRDLKAYASRALNQRFARPAGGTWWTKSGSRRPLPNERALSNANEYVWHQAYVLAQHPPARIRSVWRPING